MLDSDVDLSWRPVLCFFWPMSLGFFSSFLKKASDMVIQEAIFRRRVALATDSLSLGIVYVDVVIIVIVVTHFNIFN